MSIMGISRVETNRNGATLVEVLVAIFCMGIGLLALLTLFPIGILTMEQAILDERTTNAAQNAQAIAVVHNFRGDPYVTPLFDNSGLGVLPPNTLKNAPADAASYAVYIDPVGYRAYTGNFQSWVGGQVGGIRRATVSMINPNPPDGMEQQRILRWFYLFDDILFNKDGLPDVDVDTGRFNRGDNFSWAYLLRRPMNGHGSVVDMNIVVYNKRPLILTSNFQAREEDYPAVYDTNDNSVTIQYDPTVDLEPSVRVGNWVLDSSPVGAGDIPGHAKFYRVVSINQTAQYAYRLELEQPLQDFPAFAQTPGRLVLLDGVAAVFDNGNGWRPAFPGQ